MNERIGTTTKVAREALAGNFFPHDLYHILDSSTTNHITPHEFQLNDV